MQVFAILEFADDSLKHVRKAIPVGSMVEVLLLLPSRGLDGLIMCQPHNPVCVLFNGKQYGVPKNWLGQFWIV
jgi:hypothetical protein